MTSNLGSQLILERQIRSIGITKEDAHSEESLDSQIREVLGQHFKPEFLNRIDEVIVFHSLRANELKQIVDINIAGLQNRLAEKQVKIIFLEAAKEHLAMTGYDPIYGARPLRRVIQKEVENPLAMKILAKEINSGDQIVVDLGTEGLTFEKQNRFNEN